MLEISPSTSESVITVNGKWRCEHVRLLPRCSRHCGSRVPFYINPTQFWIQSPHLDRLQHGIYCVGRFLMPVVTLFSKYVCRTACTHLWAAYALRFAFFFAGFRCLWCFRGCRHACWSARLCALTFAACPTREAWVSFGTNHEIAIRNRWFRIDSGSAQHWGCCRNAVIWMDIFSLQVAYVQYSQRAHFVPVSPRSSGRSTTFARLQAGSMFQ